MLKHPSKKFWAMGLALSCCLFFFPARAQDIPDHPAPFFLMGDGWIHIRNLHNGLEARVHLLNPDGSLSDPSFDALDRVFGLPTRDKGEHISQRLIFMLDYFSDLAAPGKPISLHSGFRPPDYNQKLKNSGGNVARTSTHIDGLAIDFSIDGVKGKDLWELIRRNNCCGVGHYGGEVIHLDSARPRFWEAATSKVTTGESDYNRRITLSTEYDRYRPGQRLRLSFASVSDFGFGVKGKAVLWKAAESSLQPKELEIENPDRSGCSLIPDRKASRFIFLTLPDNLDPGNYRIQLDFCQRPSEHMPTHSLSNPIEILKPIR